MQRPAFVGLAGAARARYETHYLLVHDGLAALSDGAIVGKPITVVPLSVFSARTGYYGLRRQHGARRRATARQLAVARLARRRRCRELS